MKKISPKESRAKATTGKEIVDGVTLQIQKIATTDFRTPLSEWQPDTLEDTWVSIELTIGEVGTPNAEPFCLLVSTAEAFRLHDLKRSSIELGMHTMIVDVWDWPTIQNEIEDKVKACQAKTWPESLKALSLHFTREQSVFFLKQPGKKAELIL